MTLAQRTIALVSCVKSKRAHPTLARDLYTSALFTKARTYAEQYADAWFILSAKYGLVHPDTVLEPYEQTLNTASTRERRVWAKRVYGQMETARLLMPGTEFLWLAGVKYQNELAGLLSQYPQTDPMRGMRFGQRLQWLNEQIRRQG